MCPLGALLCLVALSAPAAAQQQWRGEVASAGLRLPSGTATVSSPGRSVAISDAIIGTLTLQGDESNRPVDADQY